MLAAAVWLVPVALFACGEMTDTDAPSLDALVFQDLGTAAVSDTGDYTGDLVCLLYTSPSPRDGLLSRMPSSA